MGDGNPLTSVTMMKLAREAAIGVRPIESTLVALGISAEAWAHIKDNPNFKALLANERAAWDAASAVGERIKVKSGLLLESWLNELNILLHNEKEPLSAKIEGGKFIAGLAGLTRKEGEAEKGGRLSVTINLGADSQLRFEKDVTPKVIEGEVING